MPTAVILSMGMLNQRVNIDAFFGKMVGAAVAANAAFKLTKEITDKCFSLSARFNRNEIAADTFMQELTQELQVVVKPEEFWKWWNDIVTVGSQIGQNLEELNFFGRHHNCLLYFNTDINVVHLEMLQTEYNNNNVKLRVDTSPGLVANFPLYTTCQYHKNRYDLIKIIVYDIKEKQFNSPDRIGLVLGNPDNIKNEQLRTEEKKNLAQISEWCQGEGVEIVLHNNSRPLMETLEQAAPAPTAEQSKKNVMIA